MALLPRFFTVAEVAVMLHCQPATVRRMIRNGELAANMVARVWLIPATEITRLERSAFSSLMSGNET